MAYAGVLEDLRRAVALQTPERLPVLLCSEEFDVRVCGSRYDRYNRDAAEMARAGGGRGAVRLRLGVAAGG